MILDDPVFQYSAVALMFLICIFCGYQSAVNKPEYCILGKWGRVALIANCIALACLCAFVLAWGISGLFL